MNFSKNCLLIIGLSFIGFTIAQQEPKKRTQDSGKTARKRYQPKQQSKKTNRKKQPAQKAFELTQEDLQSIETIKSFIPYCTFYTYESKKYGSLDIMQLYDAINKGKLSAQDKNRKVYDYINKIVEETYKVQEGYYEEDLMQEMALKAPDQLTKMFTDALILSYNDAKIEFAEPRNFKYLTKEGKDIVYENTKKAVETFRKKISK